MGNPTIWIVLYITACDRIAVLGSGKIIAAGTMADMQASEHPMAEAVFSTAKRAPARVVGFRA